ncbi:MAG: hypothetical protein IJE18_04265, partial [Bacteroidaceae bacterium]|nr:hypothetical protein [Bacteroidaceae bacterium]
VDVNVEIIPTYNEPAYTILDAFENGGVATLTEDILLNQPLVVKNGVKAVLELNGKTITNQVANALTDVILVEEGAELTINGDGVVEAVSGNDGYAVIANGKLTINGGTFRSGKDANGEGNAVIYARGNGEVYINGGTFEKSEGDAGFVVNKKDGDRATTTIEIRGGMFKGFNPANNAAEGAGTNFVADGYSSIDNGDGTYTVVYGTAVNDATELASALANNNGGTIILSNANYGAVTAGVLKDVTIEGDGNAIMIFKTDANTKIENVNIKNVKFEYTGATADCGIVINANAQVDNLVVEGCSFVGTGAKAGRGLSGFNNSASITFRNCTFKDLGYPIYAWGGYETLTVEGCTFNNIKSWAIMPQSGFDGDLTVTGNTFENCLGGGLVKAGTLTAGHTFTFTNNEINGCTIAGDHNWFQFKVSAGTSVISGNTKDGAAWTPTTADGLK